MALTPYLSLSLCGEWREASVSVGRESLRRGTHRHAPSAHTRPRHAAPARATSRRRAGWQGRRHTLSALLKALGVFLITPYNLKRRPPFLFIGNRFLKSSNFYPFAFMRFASVPFSQYRQTSARRCGSPQWHVRPAPRPMLPNTHTHSYPTRPYPPTSRSTFAPPHPNHSRCSAATPISLKSVLTEAAFFWCARLFVCLAQGERLASARVWNQVGRRRHRLPCGRDDCGLCGRL